MTVARLLPQTAQAARSPSTLFYSTLPYSTLLYSTLLYANLLYSTLCNLFYSTLFIYHIADRPMIGSVA